MTAVGVPIGTDEYVLERAIEVVRDGGADRLARCLENMGQAIGGPHRHRVPRAENKLLCKGSGHGVVPRSLHKGRQRTAVGVRENRRARGRGRGTQSFFQEVNRLKLRPRQQPQARLSTGAGGLGLPSTEARRMSASIGSRVAYISTSWQPALGGVGMDGRWRGRGW